MASKYKNIDGVVQYKTGDFCVYFNATKNDVEIDTDRYTKRIVFNNDARRRNV